MSESRHKVSLEWVLPDKEALRKALPAMLRWRKVNLEGLAWLMARDGVARNVLAAFIRGTQENLRSDTLFDVIDALGLEIVVRRKSGTAIAKKTAALKAERGLPSTPRDAAVALDAELAKIAPDARNDNGKMNRPLTEAERAEAHELLDKYMFD